MPRKVPLLPVALLFLVTVFLTTATLSPKPAYAGDRMVYKLLSAQGVWDKKRQGRSLKLVFEFINDSNIRARITRIHSVNLAVRGVAQHHHFTRGSMQFNTSASYNGANNVDLYPGQSTRIYYLVPYENLFGDFYVKRKKWNWNTVPTFNIQNCTMNFRYDYRKF